MLSQTQTLKNVGPNLQINLNPKKVVCPNPNQAL
jgi:hypothetical protein